VVNKNTLAEIAGEISKYSRVIIFSHYNPDIDAYGSSCALTLALRSVGKHTTCVNENGSLVRYHVFPGVSEVVSQIPTDLDFSSTLALVCDCGDLSRIGDSLRGALVKFGSVINLDHHSSNTFFGKLNYVDVNACSTAEIALGLLDQLKIEPSEDVATLLYAGIIGDTGSFRYSSTTDHTFAVAQRLFQCGVKPYQVANALFGENSLASTKIHADALLGLNLLCDGRLAEVVVTREMYQRNNAVSDDTEGLVERSRDIEGVLAAMLLRDDSSDSETLWRISLRSKRTEINVAEVAQQFGGGGHRQAAAFRWRGSLADLQPRLREAMTNALGSATR